MNRGHSMQIVIVDDDAGHVELVKRNLRRSGIGNPLVTLNNGAAALDFVYRRGAYAAREGDDDLLLLLDLKMPGAVDGLEVLRQMKGDPARRAIPIIVLTTTDDPRETRRCYELGCNVYMTKPVSPVAFMESVRQLGLFLTVTRWPAGSLATV